MMEISAAAPAILDELVTANRILAREGVVDAFGHVSIRHPASAAHFCLSRARAPVSHPQSGKSGASPRAAIWRSR